MEPFLVTVEPSDVNAATHKNAHSGQEINKGRANPNVMLGRLLYELSDQISFGIMELSGGLKVISKIVLNNFFSYELPF